MFLVYLLRNENKSYIGYTNDFKRRLRQHNGEIKGGAKYTNSFKGNGEWIYYVKIKNLTKSEALSIERTAKNLTNEEWKELIEVTLKQGRLKKDSRILN